MTEYTGKPDRNEMLALLAIFNQGRLAEAEAAALSMTEKYPEESFGWKVLGVVYKQAGMNEAALFHMQKAVELAPNDAEAHSNLGLALQGFGRLDESEKCCRCAIDIRPEFAEAHYNLGNILKELGRLSDAEISLKRAIEIRPRYPDALGNLGFVLCAQGRLDEAEEAYRCAIDIHPDFAGAHYNLGTTLQAMGRVAEAQASYRRAIEISPAANAYYNLGVTLHEMGRYPEAETCFRKTLEIEPDHAGAYNNLGATLLGLHRFSDAEACFRRAIEIRPDFAEAHGNFGNVLQDLGRLAESEAAYRKALEIKPDFAEALSNLGIVLCHLGDVRAGIECSLEALKIEPEISSALGNLIFFMDLVPGYITVEQQAERKKWAALHADPLPKRKKHCNDTNPERILRIGYVSADFNDHSAANGFSSLLGKFDRSSFEVYAYSNSWKADHLTELFRKEVSVWREIAGLGDEEVADLVERDAIDILVDLSGHTGGNRLLVFARKPAPIQVSMMGYPTGTGMKAMDAILVDEVVVPPEESVLYAEEVRYLPCVIGYSAKRDYPGVNAPPLLANGFVTFGSFNRLVKISDETFALWGRVLSALPESRMILKTGELDDEGARARVLEHFEKAGVSRDRITLLGKTPWLEHVRVYNRVDLVLDPFPHGGGVTTLESIQMGVPVVTLRYPTFAGRASASILATLGLTEWIAESQDDYVRIAVEKSRDLAALSALRGKLRPLFERSLLGDPDYYLRAAEKEYRALWRKWCLRDRP